MSDISLGLSNRLINHVSASIVTDDENKDFTEEELIEKARRELSLWYGNTRLSEWILKSYSILLQAKSSKLCKKHTPSMEDLKIHDGLYRCGDYL
jgi:hypothetical protein